MFKRFWWVFLVMAVTLPVVGLLISATITYVMPKKFESTATIQFRGNWEKGIDPGAPGFKILQDHIQTMKSDGVLLKVAGNLELPNKWGYPTAEILQKLREAIRIEHRRGTELVDIIVRHTNREDARDIAADMVRAYRSVLAEQAGKNSGEILKVLRETVSKQEEQLEAIRARLGNPDETSLSENAEWKAAQDSLNEIRIRVIETDIVRRNPVQMVVHEDPVISHAPVSPNVSMNLLIGTFGGLFLSPLFSLPLIWLLNRLVKKPSQAPSLA